MPRIWKPRRAEAGAFLWSGARAHAGAPSITGAPPRDTRAGSVRGEIGTGDLYRFPKESLIAGSSPMIRKESAGASRLLQISPNPFVTTFEARMVCAEHNVVPNF